MFQTHRLWTWRVLCIAASILAIACSQTEAPCLKGARICSGDRILLCDPATGTFIEEMRCPPGGTCAGGQCVGRQFPPADRQDVSDTTILDTSQPAPETDSGSPVDDTSTDAFITEDTAQDTVTQDMSVAIDTEADGLAEPETVDDTANVPTDISAGNDTNPDNAPSGVFAYHVVPNLTVKDDIRKVSWHPDGQYALVLGLKGQVAKVELENWTTTLLTTLGKHVADVELTLDGSTFVIVGRTANDQGMLWLYHPETNTTEEVKIPTGEPITIAREPGFNRFAIGARHANNINMLYTYAPETGLSAPKGYNGPGISDLMWGDPALTPGSANVITSDGLNGAGSQTWIVSNNTVTSNAWPASFGNPGGAAWKPGGTYGVVTGVSSNKLYVFNGSWNKATLPVGTAASPNAVSWRHDGKRALIVGRAIGSPLSATIIEHRPGANGGFDSLFVDQSIINFESAPFFGHGNMHLLDVAWRPNSVCDEGLIVGSDKGSSFNPAFGLIIYYYDTADPACTPPI